MKSFLSRPTSRRVHINWDTLRLVIFPPITEAIWELFSQGGIFEQTLNSKEEKQRGLGLQGFLSAQWSQQEHLTNKTFPP